MTRVLHGPGEELRMGRYTFNYTIKPCNQSSSILFLFPVIEKESGNKAKDRGRVL